MLVFGFEGTIGARVVEAMSSVVEKKYIFSNTQAIDTFVTLLHRDEPMYIVGVGAYSGLDASALRIETRCDSRFRNRGTKNDEIKISDFLLSTPLSKGARGIGNSWCNYVSFCVARHVGGQRYGFVHVPDAFNVEAAAHAIDTQLSVIMSISNRR